MRGPTIEAPKLTDVLYILHQLLIVATDIASDQERLWRETLVGRRDSYIVSNDTINLAESWMLVRSKYRYMGAGLRYN